MPPDDEWTEADFHTPDEFETLGDLVESLQDRLSRLERDSRIIEDLKLFICVRWMQHGDMYAAQPELLNWGVLSNEIESLMRSLDGAGNFGAAVESVAVFVNGGAYTYNRDPTFTTKVQLNRRAHMRFKKALQLLWDLGTRDDVDLGFTPDVRAGTVPPIRHAQRMRLMLAIAASFAFIGGLLYVLSLLLG